MPDEVRMYRGFNLNETRKKRLIDVIGFWKDKYEEAEAEISRLNRIVGLTEAEYRRRREAEERAWNHLAQIGG